MLALTFSVLIGVPLGVISAVRQNTKLDYVLRIISLSGLSMPAFWLGLLILMASVAYFGTIPIYSDAPTSFWNALVMYSVPAAAVGFRSSALLMRMTRSSMLEVLRQDYIRTARSKGASETVINYYHALKNAMLPVVTVIGIEAAFLLGGLIVTETVFNIPGVARFLVEAVRWRDYPMVQNLVMFIAIVVVTVNFHRRHAVRRARPAHQVRRLARMQIQNTVSPTGDRTVSTTDFQAELTAAGADVNTRWDWVRFFIRRYPLGAGGAVIMGLFLFARPSRRTLPCTTRYRPMPRLRWRGRAGSTGSAPISWAATSTAASSTARASRSRCRPARWRSAARSASSSACCPGYLLGWFDLVTQRVLEMMQALPLLVLAIIMAAALGPSLHNTIIAIAIPLVPYVARVIRSNTLSLREQPFVEAAKATGMSESRIAIRHILPNTMAPLIVLATAQLGSTILIEASLSFLGLGVPEPHPSWGRMLSELAAEYVRTAPWLVIFPGVAISFVVFGTNLLGDALRDLLDPRQRS